MARVEAPGPVTPDQGKFLDARHDPTHPLVRGRTKEDVLSWPPELGEELEREMIEPGMGQESIPVSSANGSINTDLIALDLELLNPED